MSGDAGELRAQQNVAEAEKKVKDSEKFFTSLFGGASTKLEEATDLYSKAGNNFKMCKKWTASGNAFVAAASIHLKLGSRHDAATAYCDAANSYRKSDASEAVTTLLKAIEIYTDMGRFSIAAKHHITIAEICETEMADMEQAIKHYERASDYYRGEESNSSANKCSLKVAMLTCQIDPPDFDKASKVFKMLGTSAMDNTLLKYSAKDYFFKAVLCHLSIDLVNGQIAVNEFSELCPSFSDSRECKLLQKLLTAMEADNTEDYTAAIAEYDSISRLDQWHTAIFLRIKKRLHDDDDLK